MHQALLSTKTSPQPMTKRFSTDSKFMINKDQDVYKVLNAGAYSYLKVQGVVLNENIFLLIQLVAIMIMLLQEN